MTKKLFNEPEEPPLSFRQWLFERTGNHAEDIAQANAWADEMERLQHALNSGWGSPPFPEAEAAGGGGNSPDVRSAADEIELLRDQRDTNLAKEVATVRRLEAEIERLRETLTYTTLTPNAPSAQFIAILDAAEKGEPVNAQDLINALWWRVRNQRGELRKKNQEAERLRNDIQELTCGDPRLVSSPEPGEHLDSGKTKLAIVMLDRFRDGRIQTAGGTHTSLLGPREQLLEEADWFDHAAKVLRSTLQSASPADLIGALQDTVHEDTGAVRAGRSGKPSSAPASQLPHSSAPEPH